MAQTGLNESGLKSPVERATAYDGSAGRIIETDVSARSGAAALLLVSDVDLVEVGMQST